MSDFELMRRKYDKALVRVYSKDAGNRCGWWHCAVDINGKWALESFVPYELEPIPQKHKAVGYLNISKFSDAEGYVFATYRTADLAKNGRASNCLATKRIEIEFEEGEGL